MPAHASGDLGCSCLLAGPASSRPSPSRLDEEPIDNVKSTLPQLRQVHRRHPRAPARTPTRRLHATDMTATSCMAWGTSHVWLRPSPPWNTENPSIHLPKVNFTRLCTKLGSLLCAWLKRASGRRRLYFEDSANGRVPQRGTHKSNRTW